MLKQIRHQDNIRKKHFKEIAEILRSGNLSELSPATLSLLADHLEGKVKRPQGGQTADCNDEEAERMYQELQSYMEYGCSISEVFKIDREHWNDKNKIKELKEDLRNNSMGKTKAYEAMSKESYSLLNRNLSPEQIRKIVEFGEEVHNYNMDRLDEYYNSDHYDGK